VAVKRPSVLDYCVQAQGARRGGITAAKIALWAIASVDLGHFATTVEYAEWAAVDERTAWRDRARIVEVFGDVEPVVMSLAARVGDRRSPAAVSRLAVPA
jgi:hypothetical protein